MICFHFAQRYPWAHPEVVMNMTYPQLRVLAADKYTPRKSKPNVIQTSSPEVALAIVRGARKKNSNG